MSLSCLSASRSAMYVKNATMGIIPAIGTLSPFDAINRKYSFLSKRTKNAATNDTRMSIGRKRRSVFMNGLNLGATPRGVNRGRPLFQPRYDSIRVIHSVEPCHLLDPRRARHVDLGELAPDD